MVRIAVIGCGVMGIKIAGNFSYFGHIVKMYDADLKQLDSVCERIHADEDELYRDGLIEVPKFVGQILCFSRLEDAVKDVEFVFECIIENLEIKQAIFDKVELNPTKDTKPLILDEEQRDARRQARIESLKKNSAIVVLRGRSSLPELNTARNARNEYFEFAPSNENDCAICMDRQRNAVIRSCNHFVACYECARLLHARKDSCPLCRKRIDDVIRVYT
ncbi:unnamed protein product [Didymodactylos carnosus]|uniref:RING-type domain-containing protein n=1 Tax=Didymodactylos carnosus TaxID=1234261 RepID=A0A813VVG8_9BILA|nr:unnamed protein product [Didymodactylos carnosus]CAF3634670.1 unnamed protein product [Didymodactylos carnosus]